LLKKISELTLFFLSRHEDGSRRICCLCGDDFCKNNVLSA
jgi:hypothetical protein